MGIVEDTKNAGLDKPAGPELYFSAAQAAQYGLNTDMNFVVRADGDPVALAPSVRAAVGEVDRTLPVYGLRPMVRSGGEVGGPAALSFPAAGHLFRRSRCSSPRLVSMA